MPVSVIDSLEGRVDSDTPFFYVKKEWDEALSKMICVSQRHVYRKDIQGNICAILDSTGNVVVEYKYDAWGNHAVLNASGGDIEEGTHIGNMNPFRYRGYYYDTETGLYYLKSRYYDPETGRFISIDGISYLDTETVNGLNLYAYCLDNPMMYVDLNGCSVSLVVGGLIALFGLLAVGTIEAVYHPIGNFLTWGYNSLSDLIKEFLG